MTSPSPPQLGTEGSMSSLAPPGSGLRRPRKQPTHAQINVESDDDVTLCGTPEPFTPSRSLSPAPSRGRSPGPPSGPSPAPSQGRSPGPPSGSSLGVSSGSSPAPSRGRSPAPDTPSGRSPVPSLKSHRSSPSAASGELRGPSDLVTPRKEGADDDVAELSLDGSDVRSSKSDLARSGSSLKSHALIKPKQNVEKKKFWQKMKKDNKKKSQDEVRVFLLISFP